MCLYTVDVSVLICAFQCHVVTNDVYGEQELVGSLNPLLPTNDGISNTLMTLEINEALYGNNETEGLYSEAAAMPTSALVSIQNPINIRTNTQHVYPDVNY